MKVVCPHCRTEFEVKKPKKSYSVGVRDPFSKLLKILNFLKRQGDWVWIRKIAKETGLKPYSVSYLIEKYLGAYVEMLEPTAVYETSGLKLKMFRLINKEIEPQKIIEELKVRTNR
jgi:hypothetical protein